MGMVERIIGLKNNHCICSRHLGSMRVKISIERECTRHTVAMSVTDGFISTMFKTFIYLQEIYESIVSFVSRRYMRGITEFNV